MRNAKLPNFSCPMTRAERIIGWVYLPIHMFLLPIYSGLIFTPIMELFGIPLTDSHLSVMYYGLGFLVVLIGMFRYLKRSFSDIFDHPLYFLQAVVLAYVAKWVLEYAVSFLLIAVLPEVSNPNQTAITQQTQQNTSLMIVAIVLFAPIVEEVLFRGMLFGVVRRKSRVLAYVLSTVVFAVYHIWKYFLGGFDWTLLLYMLQYVPGGLALAWCYERSGTVWAPIVLHLLNNVFVFTVTTLL